MSENINIPEPCSVKWTEMNPIDGNKRHCLSCQTPVIDFTEKSLDEIQDFFKNPINEGSCGRYSNRHTNHASGFQLQLNKLEAFFVRHRMRRLALLLIGGIIFISSGCRSKMGKTGKRGSLYGSDTKIEQSGIKKSV